jgi:hypothetical protein
MSILMILSRKGTMSVRPLADTTKTTSATTTRITLHPDAPRVFRVVDLQQHDARLTGETVGPDPGGLRLREAVCEPPRRDEEHERHHNKHNELHAETHPQQGEHPGDRRAYPEPEKEERRAEDLADKENGGENDPDPPDVRGHYLNLLRAVSA